MKTLLSNKSLYIRIILSSIFLYISIGIRGNDCDSIMKILKDSATSYEKKMEIADDISSLSPERQSLLLSFIKKEAIQREDKENIIKLNSYTAYAHLLCGNLDSCKYYLESTAIYLDKIKIPEISGIYNRVYGDYYNMQHNYEKAQEYYYKAISYFQNSTTKFYRKHSIPIFHSIAYPYIQEGDIESLKAVLDRMNKEVKVINDNYADIIYYGLLSYYYGNKHVQYKIRADLDSAIICDEKVVEIYENQGEKKSIYPEEMAYRYINLANNKQKKKNPDYVEINNLAEKAYKLAIPTDTAMLVNCLWLEGLSLYEMKEIKSAELVLLNLADMMDKWGASINLEKYLYLCELLSYIYVSYGDFEKALIYEKKKSECNLNIYNAEKFKAIKELQTKYETEKKEQEIKTQKKVNLFIIVIALLLIVASFFIIRWQRANRRLLRKQLEITEQEKSRIEQTIQEQEKRLRDARRREQEIAWEIQEKEKLLNDTRLKGLSDLIEAKQEIQILESEKKLLQNEIDSKEADKTIRETTQAKIITHLHNLINKKIQEPRRKKMLDTISRIDNRGILLLKEKGLTPLQIEYAVLIAAGLNPKELAFVYSVEYQTARSHRSKLREALYVESPDNLDAYLVRLLIPFDMK